MITTGKWATFYEQHITPVSGDKKTNAGRLVPD